MFNSVLIANRGEIACRVIATARRLGIRTVAVYSDADAGARHVSLADEAHHIGPPAARDSYLRADRILDVAALAGVNAIHPGYGFLSENADFADACAAAGIAFVGPTAAAIRAMGLKGTAKAIMEKAGVPVVPGYHGDDQDTDKLRAAAGEIGYPVLIKAVAGGGGKGMRRVDSDSEFQAALDGAKREAMASFSDDRVLLEKYLTKPRHIEIQVFADGHGNAVHLFERDCSLQRRHQKVIEEAPAPGMADDMRHAMGEAAVAAARAIDYRGAGTVEFIVDVSNGLAGAPFYFMEMNTRLQVEHPVTEMITGHDLVEWQFRVATGESLPCGQDDLAINGHAIEARVYAEDAARDFMPSTGLLQRLRFPPENAHVRIDTGVREGDRVTPHYDPMIAKLIVWDGDRRGALRRLAGALGQLQVVGVTTNASFLATIAGHQAFVAADLDTGFIIEHGDDLIPEAGPASGEVIALACLDILLRQAAESERMAKGSQDPYAPWHAATGWRLNDEGRQVQHFKDGDTEIDVSVRYSKAGWVFAFGDSELTVQGERLEDETLVAEISGRRILAAVVHSGRDVTVLTHGRSHSLTLLDPFQDAGQDEDAGGALSAPLPGKIVQVLVEDGAVVVRGDPLMIVEAMKMEHTISAPADGRVERVNFAAGEQVEEGTELLVFEADSDS